MKLEMMDDTVETKTETENNNTRMVMDSNFSIKYAEKVRKDKAQAQAWDQAQNWSIR